MTSRKGAPGHQAASSSMFSSRRIIWYAARRALRLSVYLKLSSWLKYCRPRSAMVSMCSAILSSKAASKTRAKFASSLRAAARTFGSGRAARLRWAGSRRQVQQTPRPPAAHALPQTPCDQPSNPQRPPRREFGTKRPCSNTATPNGEHAGGVVFQFGSPPHGVPGGPWKKIGRRSWSGALFFHSLAWSSSRTQERVQRPDRGAGTHRASAPRRPAPSTIWAGR